MKLGRPFDRKAVLIYLSYFIERKYGSYFELINLTIRDLVELGIALESKSKEAQLAQLTNL